MQQWIRNVFNLKRIHSSDELEQWEGAKVKVWSLEEGIPERLLPLVPYAEIWGHPDDRERELVVDKTPVELIGNLKWVVSQYEDDLDEWLAGPEATCSNPSDAYVAFSAMRMAVDFI